MSNTRYTAVKQWLRWGFLLWTVFSTAWLANSVRTRGVDEDSLRASPTTSVVNQAETLEFLPRPVARNAGLIFICGSGIAAEAYAPLLRPLAEAGYPVVIVKLPYRFAPLESNKITTIERALAALSAHPDVSHWVLSGHSLGGALAARIARTHSHQLSALVLIGTTHPKEDDLSFLSIPVTKLYASNDGIAPPDRVLAHQELLPKLTHWVEVKGGNHSQFGRYGHQLFDGGASIRREEQEAITRSALAQSLVAAATKP